MSHLLGAEKVSLRLGMTRLFDDVSLGLDSGDRVGVVGRNGDGKSTWLRLLAKRLDPDSGRVTHRSGVRVGVLDQQDTLADDDTVRRAVVGDMAEHEWASQPRIREVLDGMVSDLDLDDRLGHLSGGQRRRVALAQLLVTDADVLLLDEPTNHLDIQGVTWLAEHLNSRWPAKTGALVVVTHDRWFLDAVCNLTWEVHDATVEAFSGGYAAYVLQRVERDEQAAAAEAKRQNLMRKELAWLRRGAPARTSKPKFRVEAANALIEQQPPVRDSTELVQLAVARLGKDVVDLIDVDVDYGEQRVLRDVQWRIAPGERAGILGVNGAGKSTLLDLVAGTLSPSSGRVKRGKTVRTAMLSQSLRELDEFSDDRVADVIARQKRSYVAGGKEMTPAQVLDRLGLQELSTPVRELSGGQKRRLQLTLILLAEPNVLILDEPTNDLDTDVLAAMEDLLDTWPGTLLVVSHDRYLLERVTDHQYAVIAGHLRHVPGGVDEYLRRMTDNGTAQPAHRSLPDESAQEQSGLSGAQRHAAQKELASIERRLDQRSNQIGELHATMAEHDPTEYTGLQQLTEQTEDLQKEVAQLEERWLEVSEQLE